MTVNIWLCEAKKIQADVGARTRDLLLTMQVLYQLSYVGATPNPTLIVRRSPIIPRCNNQPMTRVAWGAFGTTVWDVSGEKPPKNESRAVT
jgi:hypothetical protein